MRCMFLFYFDGADEFETCDDKMGRLCEPGTPCFAMVFGVSINLFFSRASGLLWSHPRQLRCGSREPGTPCLAKVLGASISFCFSKASGLLWSHPRRQRCASAALHHTSLRSLTATASLIGSC